jgi:hypothetical protein
MRSSTERSARLVLVPQELDVAAERNQRHAPARALAIVETEKLRSEADRKHLDGHAAPARHQEMAELVEKHDDGEDEQKRHDIAGDCRAHIAEQGTQAHADVSFRPSGH